MKSLAWTITRRYLFAKKSHHLINVISWISVLGVAVGTFGLVVVLSVFNGFGNLVMQLYNSFDPDIKVQLATGRNFEDADSLHQLLLKRTDIAAITFVKEENALLRYMDRQYVVTLKGVSTSFFETSDIKNQLLEGDAILEEENANFMIPGAQIAYSMGIRPNDLLNPVNVFLPRRGIDPGLTLLDPSDAFTQKPIVASGIFGVQQDFDAKYVIVPMRFMQELTGDISKLSSFEIKLKPGVDVDKARKELQLFFGDDFIVKDRIMQHDFLAKVIGAEKVAVYFILGFILLIAAFNLFGTLTILILDKRDDLQTLFHMGADLKLAQRIFLLEGLVISVGGALVGMILGALLCGLQQHYGFIKIGEGDGFVVDAYPVAMQLNDFLMVMGIVIVIGWSAAAYTSRNIVRRVSDQRLIEA